MQKRLKPTLNLIMGNELVISIPSIPPGKNRSHGYGRGRAKKGEPRVYVTNEARKWTKDASLIIGAKIGTSGWKPSYQYYTLDIVFSAQSRLDVDAPITLVQDTLCRKIDAFFEDIEFDDRLILRTTCDKRSGEEGVSISLKGYDFAKE